MKAHSCLPNYQTNFDIVCVKKCLNFLTFHKCNSAPLGSNSPLSHPNRELHGLNLYSTKMSYKQKSVLLVRGQIILHSPTLTK